jgi:hypothetical protein
MNLNTILTSRGPQGSVEHTRFIGDLACLLIDVAGHPAVTTYMDTEATVQCIHVKIGDLPIAFTAHTDTARPVGAIAHDQNVDWYYLSQPKSQPGKCLGADDGAGIYVLIQMIAAQKPGHYFFFTGEECGGIGSSHMAKQHPELFINLKAAIAFDRRGTEDVVYEQGVGQCASLAFAEATCALLSMGHSPSPYGSFTDTANLAHLVPECLNISVGYDHEHGPEETLDGNYLSDLTGRCIEVDWATLVQHATREPGDFGVPYKSRWDFNSFAPSSKTRSHNSSSSSSSSAELTPEAWLDMTSAQRKAWLFTQPMETIADFIDDLAWAVVVGDYDEQQVGNEHWYN